MRVPSLKWMSAELAKQLSISDRGILGPDKHDLKEIRILNRIVSWENDCIRFEADQRHPEILINALKLEGANGVSTPGVNRSKIGKRPCVEVDESIDSDNEVDCEVVLPEGGLVSDDIYNFPAKYIVHYKDIQFSCKNTQFSMILGQNEAKSKYL